MKGNNGLNLLHIAVTGQMYNHVLLAGGGGAEPPRAEKPGEYTNKYPGGDPAQQSNEKQGWERGKCIHAEENNMESALIERILQLIPDKYKQDFLTAYARKSNTMFHQACMWFYNRYG